MSTRSTRSSSRCPIDRAIDFYVDKLGFEKRADIPFGNGYRWVEVAPATRDDDHARPPPPDGKPAGNRETGIGLHVDDIDAYHARAEGRPLDVDPEVSRMGGPVPPLLWLRDPEGNTLMVIG